MKLGLERELLQRWLEKQDYNEQLGLQRAPFSSPGYHTALQGVPFVHRTRESLSYAVALLDAGGEEELRRACKIIDTVVALQDTDPNSKTYGIWSWFYEEPLDRMAPPDWNWADFCGKLLLTAVLRHASRLPAELLERIREAVFHASEAIIRRNVGPGYTNIAIMGSFVTLIAGEVYGRTDLLEYGLKRLDVFHQYTGRLGTFEEYNSPTYTTVAIVELSALHTYTRTPEAKRLTEELLTIAWGMVANHFHPRTMQWSGPHARSYDTLLAPGHLSFLQLALQDSLYTPLVEPEALTYDPNWFGSGIRCPEQFVRFFTETPEREVRQLYYVSPAKGIEKHAACYLTDTFSIGTVSRENMWGQRRNLLAYAANGEGTAYIRLRSMRDGDDFAAGVLSAVQDKETVLFGMSYSTDGGDRHNSLDRIQGVITASDLRVRLEIGGCLDGVAVEQHTDETIHAKLGQIWLNLTPVHSVWGNVTVHWEWSRQKDTIALDCVLYRGDERQFDLRELEHAGCLAVLSLTRSHPQKAETRLVLTDDSASALCLMGNDEESTMHLSIPLRPAKMEQLLAYR